MTLVSFAAVICVITLLLLGGEECCTQRQRFNGLFVMSSRVASHSSATLTKRNDGEVARQWQKETNKRYRSHGLLVQIRVQRKHPERNRKRTTLRKATFKIAARKAHKILKESWSMYSLLKERFQLLHMYLKKKTTFSVILTVYFQFILTDELFINI